ncbi:MAG: formylglycine-generating enzyme family protein [Ardenticatenia bacterium]|nr:formylglycine-generating enzyme family protein [Ardenticatenia bacterium]
MRCKVKLLVVLTALVSLGLVITACSGLQPAPPPEPDVVLIPAGEFTMGSDPGSDPYAFDDQQPQHTLYLPDYYLAKTPVTNAQYAAFVQAAGHDPPSHWDGGKPPSGKEDHPVVNVTWHDAVAYGNWLAQATGKPYRLPSEAEWEKGARGSDGRIYPWGNQWDVARCNSREGGKGDTTPVGAYPEGASPYGLLDMVGNVWELTRSAYEVYPYDPEDGREDLEASDATRRTARGGSFGDDQRLVRCAFRTEIGPLARFRGTGFRVMLAPD